VVRATTAVEWAALGPTVGTRHGRFDVVRRFARLVHVEDPRHEIPCREPRSLRIASQSRCAAAHG
jgi:hypothetical protein